MPFVRKKDRPGESAPKKEDKQDKDVFVPEDPKYTFDDIILPDHVREEVMNVADYAKNSKIVFEDWGLAETHKYSKQIGINLYGEPGTGKTMVAHAIAKHLGRKILVVNYADIESKYVGETPKNIQKVFEAGKETGSIIFFDEADAILSRRVTNMTSATDVSVNQTRSVMLLLMNEYQDFIIFATNFISNFDPAFMRRISVHVRFELPDLKCRKLLWEKYIPSKMPLTLPKYELAARLAEQFEGISGGDISNAVLNAAFMAARHGVHHISEDYFERAVKSILVSKKANQKKSDVTVTRKPVSEEYVKKQLRTDNL
ncbi:MAG: ATP-binding protein [Selenomonadaceae bacterium]|nr:ATP-binding protein [Selenomonadaceae bacterium]